MYNLSEDPGNESYLESDVSNFCDDEGINFSASFSLKSKLFKKILRSILVPSESKEENDGEEMKSTSTKTSMKVQYQMATCEVMIHAMVLILLTNMIKIKT